MSRYGISPRASKLLFGDLKCTASNRDGERCGNRAMPAQTVCFQHGGGAPLAKGAAQKRIDGIVFPAIDVLERAVKHDPPCDKCGRADSDRDPNAIKAAALILKLAGVGVGESEARGGSSDSGQPDFMAWIPAERQELMARWVLEAKREMQSGVPPPTKVIDAHIIDRDDLGLNPGEGVAQEGVNE